MRVEHLNGPLTHKSNAAFVVFVCFQASDAISNSISNLHSHSYCDDLSSSSSNNNPTQSCSYVEEQIEPEEENELTHCIQPGALHKETDEDQLMAMAYEVLSAPMCSK